MAQAIADRLAFEHGVDAEAQSAGTIDLSARSAHDRVLAVCREVGIELAAHRSQPVTVEHIDWATAIFVMESAHAQHVRTIDDGAEPRIVHLASFVGLHEIADPYGSWFNGPYRRSRDQLFEALKGWFSAEGLTSV